MIENFKVSVTKDVNLDHKLFVSQHTFTCSETVLIAM